MLRYGAYFLLFLFLALGGMIALEFQVGLQLYRVDGSTHPIWRLDLREATKRPDGDWLLLLRSGTEDPREEAPIEIPISSRKLRLEFQGIRFSGVARRLADDRVKLAWVQPVGTTTRLPVNGGTDSCWKLVHNAKGMTMGLAESKTWTLDVELGDAHGSLSLIMGSSGPELQRSDSTALRKK